MDDFGDDDETADASSIAPGDAGEHTTSTRANAQRHQRTRGNRQRNHHTRREHQPPGETRDPI
eukprot:6932926-Prorocentrum_lima.AAC.1